MLKIGNPLKILKEHFGMLKLCKVGAYYYYYFLTSDLKRMIVEIRVEITKAEVYLEAKVILRNGMEKLEDRYKRCIALDK